MSDYTKQGNRFYKVNDRMFLLVARCVKASMSEEYDNCLVITVHKGCTFCIPMNIKIGGLREDSRYNLYLDLDDGEPVLANVSHDWIGDSGKLVNYIFMFRACYSCRKLPIYLTEDTKNDIRFYAYTGYLDAVFTGDYEGEIDVFIETLDPSEIILSYIFVGASVLIKGHECFVDVEAIDGIKFKLENDSNWYSVCDIKALV